MKNELYAANQQQAFGIAVLLLVLVISPVIIFLVRNATVTIQVTFNFRRYHSVCVFLLFYSSTGVFNIPVKKSPRAETREKKSRCPDLSDVASFCSKGFIKIPSEGKISCWHVNRVNPTAGIPAAQEYERCQVWLSHHLLQWPGGLHTDGGGEHAVRGHKGFFFMRFSYICLCLDGHFPKLILQDVWQSLEQVWHLQGEIETLRQIRFEESLWLADWHIQLLIGQLCRWTLLMTPTWWPPGSRRRMETSTPPRLPPWRWTFWWGHIQGVPKNMTYDIDIGNRVTNFGH